MIDEMLYEAFDKVKDTTGLIFHSDQGWQYQHYGYRKALEKKSNYSKHVQKRKLLRQCLGRKLFWHREDRIAVQTEL